MDQITLDKIRALLNRGASPSQVAKILNIDVGLVIRYRYTTRLPDVLTISSTKVTSKIEQIKNLYEQGRSEKQISIAVGKPINYVRCVITTHTTGKYVGRQNVFTYKNTNYTLPRYIR